MYFGNAKGRGLAHPEVSKQNLQLTEHQVSILAPGVPVPDDPLRCQIEHPLQGIVVGKAGLILGDPPELPVQTLNDVGGVYDFPDLRRVFKECAQNLLVVLPALDAGRVLFTLGIEEPAQVLFCFVQSNGGVDFLHVGNDLLDIL